MLRANGIAVLPKDKTVFSAGEEVAVHLLRSDVGMLEEYRPYRVGDPKEHRLVFNHFDARGQAIMVDVSGKSPTLRTAVAEAQVALRPETLAAIIEGRMTKGAVSYTHLRAHETRHDLVCRL